MISSGDFEQVAPGGYEETEIEIAPDGHVNKKTTKVDGRGHKTVETLEADDINDTDLVSEMN